MRPGIIRWIDKNLGSPVCFLLTLHRRSFDLFKKSPASYQKSSKVLFIKLVEQGSTVLAYSALSRACDLVGKDNIYFLVFKENRPILDILDIVPVGNIIEINPHNPLTFIYSTLKAISRIRIESIDAVLDLEFFSRTSAIICYLCGATKRVGLHRFNAESPYRGNLFTHRLIYNPYLHTELFFSCLVEALNYPPLNSSPMVFEIPKTVDIEASFTPTQEERKSITEKVQSLKKVSLGRPLIILNPKISDLLPLRKWPEEKFISLSKMILQEFPQASVIITGSSREKDKSKLMASQIPNAISLAGLINLRELLTLYCIADILVTSDSGPALFSTLTPIRSVVLFGPETPFLYGKVSPKVDNIASDFVCSPCINVYNARNSPCLSNSCLRSIKVEDVYKKVKTLLGQP